MRVFKYLDKSIYKYTKKYFSSLKFKNKVVIVTGGSSGIGRATCIQFAKEGAKVVCSDLNEKEGRLLTNEIESSYKTPAHFIKSDVSNKEDAEKITQETLDKFGRVDVLVNSAAKFVLKGFDATEEEWHKSFGVNVIGLAFVSKFASEAMKKTGGGSIVNVASISSWIAQPDFFVYSTSKAAILQITRNMALDLGPHNIRVNCVCPGTILTPASVKFIESKGGSKDELIRITEKQTISKRIGLPEDIAPAIAFLASKESSYINGTHLMIDGGYTTI